MAAALQTESWETVNWKQIQKNVYRLQKRIYQASSKEQWQKVRNLQRLLLRSKSAKLLATRQVTQDNRGKKTAGVDGKANLKPSERLALANKLDLKGKADPIRRVYIPKANGEQRPLGIPTIAERVRMTLVKLVLEPEWEAKFEPNSYGFRPGRSAHDAITAIYLSIKHQGKYVLDADIEKCFDKIDRKALLTKLKAIPLIQSSISKWLKAGIMDGDTCIYPEAGTPQGSSLSPLLANVALHGMEACASLGYTQRTKVKAARLIRYADDFVVIHEDLNVIKEVKHKLEDFLAAMGLKLKASKTCITHTLNPFEGKLGFDFLGFHVRQYKVGKHRTGRLMQASQRNFKTLIKPSKASQAKHLQELKKTIKLYANAPTDDLIRKLNPKIRGWANYFCLAVSGRTFSHLDSQLVYKLIAWVKRRSKLALKRAIPHYFALPQWRLKSDEQYLYLHCDVSIKRHVKVKGDRSPFDGDVLYWARRLGRSFELPMRKAKLLKRQQGKCYYCGLYFSSNNIMEVHHIDGNNTNNSYQNLALVMGHCHDELHRGTHDKS